MTATHANALDPFEDQSDIGQVHQPGSCDYDSQGQVYTIAGAGANIGGGHDDFHFVWRRMRGNFIVTARAGFSSAEGHPQRMLGWMARASLDADSPSVSAAVYGGDEPAALQFRRTQGGLTQEMQAPRRAARGADVIQLERDGSTYTMSIARYGEPFITVQASEIELGETLYVGLFVCSHEEEAARKAIFRNVRIVAPVKAGFDRWVDPFGSRMEILDVASGDRQIIYSTEDVFEAPNWTRDGKALIFNSQGRLYRLDLETKTPVLIDTGDVLGNNNDHVLSFEGSVLAISSHGGKDNHAIVYTVPVQGGQPKQITPVGPSYLHGWSPDGKFLVYTGLRNGDYDIYRIPIEGGKEEQLTTAPGLDDGPEYTPDGRYIYFNSVRSGSMQIWRMQADGSQQEQLTDDEYNNWFPHISPDGKWVIFVTYLANEVKPSDHPPAKRVYLRMMPLDGGAPKVVAYLYGGQGSMNVPSWSPDGKKVAFVSNTVPY
jgi:TolB protein